MYQPSTKEWFEQIFLKFELIKANVLFNFIPTN